MTLFMGEGKPLRFCTVVLGGTRDSSSSDDGSDLDSHSAAGTSYVPQTVREIVSPPACYRQRVFGVVDILCMEDTSRPQRAAASVTFADQALQQELVAKSGSDEGSSIYTGSDSMSVGSGLHSVPEQEAEAEPESEHGPADITNTDGPSTALPSLSRAKAESEVIAMQLQSAAASRSSS